MKCLSCFAVAMLLSAVGCLQAEAQEIPPAQFSVRLLHDFLGDQCTFAPDLDIGSCCGAHDQAYAIGGNRRDRRQADRHFRRCILQAGRPLVAQIYYLGVRLFGWLFFNFG